MFSPSLPSFLTPWQATWNFSTWTIFIELDQRWKTTLGCLIFQIKWWGLVNIRKIFSEDWKQNDLQQIKSVGKHWNRFIFLFLKTQSRKRHETTCILFFGTIILWSETPNFVKSLLNRCGRCEGHEARNKSKLHDKVSSRMQQPRPKKMDAGWFLATFQVRMQGIL